MFDIRFVREHAELFDAARKRRGLPPLAAHLLALDDARKSLTGKLQASQERRNAASKEIGAAKAAKDTALADALMAEVAALKASMPEDEAALREAEAALHAAISEIPNNPAPDVPDGVDEHGNVLRHVHGVAPAFTFAPKQHFELGEVLGQMDFETASKMSGARFTILKSGLARLNRAIGQYFLDKHTMEHGYTEVNPPMLVRTDTVFGTAQYPKSAEDMFVAKPGEFWLIPTAEVSLTNMVREAITPEDELPLRLTALTPCFRAEAGAAGRDTRGMIRQHQFEKVELVSITTPEKSAEEHERMLACAEAVLKGLGLHYRVMTLCTGDMGFSSQKTYDIEVWLPGQGAFREISSCSVCGDFQARRMNARYRGKDGKVGFVHTLNGSGVAVGRALVAVLENYQNEDGSISVPEVLLPYMGGMKRIVA